MKKVCLTVMMLMLMVVGAYAQAQIGLKAGVNFASITGDDTDDLKGRVGYHVGGMASFGLTESVFLQPEILFSLQGAGFDDTDDAKFNVSYINIPVMVKVMLTEGLNIHFGPQLGILTGAKIKSDDGDLDLKDEFNSIDFGLGIGLGYQLESGLNFGARYNYGLSNLAKEGDDKINNAVLQLSLGYFFGGK